MGALDGGIAFAGGHRSEREMGPSHAKFTCGERRTKAKSWSLLQEPLESARPTQHFTKG